FLARSGRSGALGGRLLGRRRNLGGDRSGGFGFLLGGDHRGGDDGGDGEIAFGDRGLHVVRQLHLRDVDRLSDLEPCQVDDELFRNAVGGREDLDLVTHDVENAARLQSGGRLVVLE